jgi:hypothetical protein
VIRPLATGLICTALVAVNAWGCADTRTSVSASPVLVRSHWQEFSEAGKQLVQETGWLLGPQVSFQVNCDWWVGRAAYQRLSGHRDYDGVTNTGTPVLNTASIQSAKTSLELGRKITDNLELSLHHHQTRTHRQLEPIGVIRGFTEDFSWSIASVGLGYSHHNNWGQWRAGISLGRSYQAQSVLTITGRDTAQLQLATLTDHHLTAAWQKEVAPSWLLGASMQWHQTVMPQSTEAVITQNGIAIGTAHQPKTVIRDTTLGLTLSKSF